MGRYVLGVASALLGLASLTLHGQLISNWQLPGVAGFILVTSVAQVLGGIEILFRNTRRSGATLLVVVYLLFALTFVPGVVAEPGVYATWGNVFYQLALVVGAVMIYGLSSPKLSGRHLYRGALLLFGMCNMSFAIEQVEFLGRTVSLVPRWIPPNAMFWAIITAIAFGLAGIALVVGYRSLLASRLLGLMLILFGFTIWIPRLIADPVRHSNWSEGIETFAIAGVAFIVADYLRRATASPSPD